MKRLSTEDVHLAENYILHAARVLERHRFACLFGTGSAAAVEASLAAYRNPDGGFGHALEPDGRGPGSQPVAVLAALSMVDEVGAFGGDLVAGAVDYLASASAPDGGQVFVHPNIRDFPRAPWWQIPERYVGSVYPTGSIVGLLHKNKVAHPWVEAGTAFCWQAIDALTETNPYEVFGCVRFLDHVPDRDRAEATAARLGKLVRDGGHVSLSASDTGDVYRPHDFAPTPESVARQWFSDAELEASLDWLVGSQQDDGSWPVNWLIWTPITAFEWGGWVTIEALKTLTAYGRVH
jgi:hypothetical protein